MKMSVRAIRAQRHQARRAKVSKLSLVSLMDIFTILVFFLIVNSSSVEVLEADKSIKLPQSISKTLAQDNLLLLITNDELILQGKRIASLTELINSESTTIKSLEDELNYHIKRSEDTTKTSRAITVMGDKGIEYSVLKKILLTCANAGFGDISLAVEQTASKAAVLSNDQGAANVQSIR